MPKRRATVRLAHLSGRYNRPAWLLRRQLRDAAVSADIITVTEVDRPKRGKALRDVPGFLALRHGGGGDWGESAVLFRDGVWRVRRVGYYLLARDLDGMRKGQVAVLALLEHVSTGRTLLVSVTHTPSGVEAAWSSARARQYRDTSQTWRRLVREWRRDHRPDAELLVADWNLDAHKPWVREHTHAAWPGMKQVSPPPIGGTHGKRLIDWPLTRRVRGVKVRILAKTAASDHRPIGITGTIRPRKRKEHR
ncbi:hypothetical protein [Nocardioides sp. YIM 152315]|uniref:hypothetical protein n=1 Tax=Nocardioides sp. YIM 152315 TaxID=3031760 RepID=UPI0023D9D9B6|nr:hypothetical protein [Nocardioides sp. YIM 152315]MDF1603412.1 hypothetical protein [Nocardioides sp. YIM 152315]